MKAFNKIKIDLLDIILIIVYLLITITVTLGESFFDSIEAYKKFILLYTFFTPLYVYLICYRSLRNIYIFLIWILFAVYHQYLYSILIKNEVLAMVRGHSANGLQYTIIFIIIFQILRIIHLYFFKRELIGWPLPGRMKDLFDDIKPEVSDIIFFVIYNAGWILLMIKIK